MQLREGRLIDETDSAERVDVAVVNETFARRYMPGRSAIGVRVGNGDELNTHIVGVVADARVNGVREAPTPMVFYALAQEQGQIGFPRYLDVRVNGDPGVVGAQVRRAVANVDPRVSVGPATPIETALARGMSRDRLIAFVSMAFAAVALLLACVGVYGVLAYGVARRVREMGVRAALGATPSALARLVVREGVRVTIPGLLAGVAIALAGARVLETQLFGVNPYDVSTHLATVITLLLSVLAACHLPARRAAGIDPAAALRSE
jgi:predicted lysophospholipase L1 biosynthesis ABC-type transport system permease subunit